MKYSNETKLLIMEYNETIENIAETLSKHSLKTDCNLRDIHIGIRFLETQKNMIKDVVKTLEIVYESVSVDNENKLNNLLKEKK